MGRWDDPPSLTHNGHFSSRSLAQAVIPFIASSNEMMRLQGRSVDRVSMEITGLGTATGSHRLCAPNTSDDTTVNPALAHLTLRCTYNPSRAEAQHTINIPRASGQLGARGVCEQQQVTTLPPPLPRDRQRGTRHTRAPQHPRASLLAVSPDRTSNFARLGTDLAPLLSLQTWEQGTRTRESLE